MEFNHIGLNCKDPIAIEKFYTKHFGFTRGRVIPLGEDNQLVFLKGPGVYLEIFKTGDDRPMAAPEKDGYVYVGTRHLAFKVDDIDAVLASIGADAQVTLGPLDFSAFIPGWKTVWVADPEGNIVEISQGYVDQENPPPLV
ncbi:MAG: VOC family protein [Anaerolineae bacterium]|nr:VOC family protein [Anaerolineae bacterium]NUQ02820.1 VOC family protein [Anaerolineae bacterium]